MQKLYGTAPGYDVVSPFRIAATDHANCTTGMGIPCHSARYPSRARVAGWQLRHPVLLRHLQGSELAPNPRRYRRYLLPVGGRSAHRFQLLDSK